MRPLIFLALLVTLSLSAGSAARCEIEMLTGIVLDVDGKRVAGATINVAKIFHSPPVRLKTTTDEQGRFSVDLPPDCTAACGYHVY
jgi:hypothetical protein